MRPRIFIAALSLAIFSAVPTPSPAQTPEQSPDAKAAPQAPSESASSSSSALPASKATVRPFTAERSKDPTNGKAAVVPPGAAVKDKQ
jgi:hypothetical protein